MNFERLIPCYVPGNIMFKPPQTGDRIKQGYDFQQGDGYFERGDVRALRHPEHREPGRLVRLWLLTSFQHTITIRKIISSEIYYKVAGKAHNLEAVHK